MSTFSIFGSTISSTCINLHPCHFKFFTLTVDFTSHCEHLSAPYNEVYMYLMLDIPNGFDFSYTLPFYTKRLLSCSWNYQTEVLLPVSINIKM